ncbi:MAG: hypothetical protein ACRCUJ_05940, partial [Phocaeicola sp.]
SMSGEFWFGYALIGFCYVVFRQVLAPNPHKDEEIGFLMLEWALWPLSLVYYILKALTNFIILLFKFIIEVLDA